MKDRHSLALHEKLARLSLTYIEQLPEIVVTARRLGERLRETPESNAVLGDLHRTFHNIKGAATSFGLKQIGAVGADGVELIVRLQRLDPMSRQSALKTAIGELWGYLNRLEALSAEALERSPDDGGRVPLPVSDAFGLPGVPVRTAGARVFLCDDDRLVGQQIAEQLGCFGYVVTLFEDPEKLRDAVLIGAPDAVVMDIVFPDGSRTGTDVAIELRNIHGELFPIVFISGHSDFQSRLQSIQAGGRAFFTKPVPIIRLVEVLDALTSRKLPEPFHILIVDDDPIVAAYHGAILEQAGMVARLLEDPSRILEVLDELRPDLVLMDVYMPACSGHDLAMLIRQIPEYVALPILFLSGETDRVKQASAMSVGAEGFLTKPIHPEDLVDAVSLRAERMRVLRSLMVRDSLTGLFNHTFVTQFTETTLAAAERSEYFVSFVMIDLDHFKQINDTHGHPMGDQVLLALSRLLQQRLRASDMVGRYGGEEFAAIMRCASEADAIRVVDRIRQDFATIRFRSEVGEFSCTFSAGIASFPIFRTGTTLRQAADQALYAAKHGGRNRVKVAEGIP
ncbi:MAG: diguanylate cyclase [Alphaproteobacteria bacterium]